TSWPHRFGATHQRDRRQSCAHFDFAQQRVFRERVIPLREIAERRIDAAIAERRGSRALIGLLPRATVSRMPERAIGDFVFALLVRDRLIHFQRRKDALVEELTETFA